MSILAVLVAALSASTTASAKALETCKKTFEGRIPPNDTAQTFVTDQSPFNPGYVHGANVTWDQIITFPNVTPSYYDKKVGAKPVQLRIDDKSVFGSPSEGVENALRRAELLVNNKNETVSGRKTWFYSFYAPSTKPLNLTHENVLVFQEAQDFQADFYSIKIGQPMDANVGYGKFVPGSNKTDGVTDEMFRKGEIIYVSGYKWAVPMGVYFMAPFSFDTWHNFAIYLDYPANRMQVSYSVGQNPPYVSTPLLSNNISGAAVTTLGETHIGIQKRPYGANLTNFLFNGEQPSGIDETLVVGGIFQIEGKPQKCKLS